MVSSDYQIFLNETIASLKQKFPQISLKSFSEFKSFLDSLVPKLIHKYMLLSYSMKVCSGISPDFAEIAATAGFPVLVQQIPGHFMNIVLTSDGPYAVDLSHIQFLCKHTAYDPSEREEVLNSYKELYKDPFKAIKIEKLPESYLTGISEPHGQYDNLYNPVKWINNYNIEKTEELFPETFDRLKEPMKKAYFQGGGGGNEPTPKKKKYKDEPINQDLTKARGVLFRNYDTYNTGDPTPGTGFYQHMNEYDSIADFRKAKRDEKMRKRRQALFEAIMVSTASDVNALKKEKLHKKVNEFVDLVFKRNEDYNNLADPDKDETMSEIPWGAAEPGGSPIGLMDGVTQSPDLEGQPIGNPYYGMTEMHRVEE